MTLLFYVALLAIIAIVVASPLLMFVPAAQPSHTVQTATWSVAHIAAIAVWLFLVSPLWRHQVEQRCADFGDTLHAEVIVLPGLCIGVLAAGIGLIHAVLKRRSAGGSNGVALWTTVVLSWIFAASTALLWVRQDVQVACAGSVVNLVKSVTSTIHVSRSAHNNRGDIHGQRQRFGRRPGAR
jgi:hypothetical protein